MHRNKLTCATNHLLEHRRPVISQQLRQPDEPQGPLKIWYYRAWSFLKTKVANEL